MKSTKVFLLTVFVLIFVCVIPSTAAVPVAQFKGTPTIGLAPLTVALSNTTVIVSNSSNTLGIAVNQDMSQTIYATTIPTVRTTNTDIFSGSSNSGANATTTISVPIPRYEKPIVHITSPKTYYSSPPSGNSEKFQVPGGLTIPSGKQNTIIDKNNLTKSQKKLTTALLLVSDPSVQVASPNNNEIQLSLITKTVPKSVETLAISLNRRGFRKRFTRLCVYLDEPGIFNPYHRFICV